MFTHTHTPIARFKSWLFEPRFQLNRFQFNLVALFFVAFGLLAGSYFTLKGISSIFATTTSSVTKDTDTHFSQGTLTSTSVSGSGTTAVVQLSGTSGPDGTTYKRAITITNAGGVLTDYQVLITMDSASLVTSGKLQSSCADLRVNDSDDSTALSYWIETGCNTSSTKIWVKVPSIPASSSKIIYLYYGSASATAQASGINTFMFFDDFSSGLSANWTSFSGHASAPTKAVNNGELVISGSRVEGGVFYSGFSMTDGILETKAKLVTYTGGGQDTLVAIRHNSGTDVNAQFYRYGAFWAISDNINIAREPGHANLGSSSYSYGQGVWKKIRLTAVGTQIIGVVLDTNDVQQGYLAITDGNYASGTIGFCVDFYHESAVAGESRFDDVRVRKYTSSEPSTSLGSEVGVISVSGTWESATDSNVIDLAWNGGWGDGTSGSTAFSATVANVGTNNTIAFAMRVGSSTSALTSASYVTLGTANSGTTFTKTKADLDALGLATGTARYIQVKATLAQTSGTNPQLDNFTISYLSDNTAPETNATGLDMLRSAGGTTVTSNGWTNNSSPYFSWTAGSDSQAGLKGYCLYLGTDANGDPATSKGLLGTSPVSTTGSTCQFIISGTSVDLATSGYISTALTTSNSSYYFNVKAIDNSNNIAVSTTQFQFRFDNTAPTNVAYISCASGNFANVADMGFNWPTSGSTASSDSNAGLLGWQYQINSTSGTWLGTTTESTLGVANYITSTETGRTLSQDQDGSSIITGNNIVYFRTVDLAGNTSSSTIRTCNLSYGGAAPAFGGTDSVTVTPSTATSNSFALSWPIAIPSNGRTVTHYYYMINTAPPSTYATITGNTSTYIDNGTTRTVLASALANVNKGSNTVYVIAVDDQDNYSPSNYISGTFTLNSTDPDNVGNLVASDSSIKASSQWNVTLTWTVPTYQGAGNLTYTVKRSTDNSTFTQVGTSTGLSYVDNTPSSALYYYKVYTKDGANTQSSGTNAVFITPTGKWTSAPDLSTGPTAGSLTTKKASITWTTSRSADSKIQFGTTSGSYSSDEVSNSSQTSSHTVNLTNLKAGTTYYYKAKWTDEDGNTGTSDEKTFNTVSAPIAKNVSVTSLGLTSGLINYTVTNASSVKIYYGTTTSFGGSIAVSTSTSETAYTTQLTGLLDGTKYYYKINSFDGDSNEYEGTVLDFTTLPRPKISNVRIQQVANTTQSTILVSWNTNTEVSSIVTYYPSGDPASARDEVNVALVKGEHKIIIRALLPNTTYNLIVKGRDKIGNEAQSDIQRVTTATDTRPPQIYDLHVEGSNIPPVTSTAQEQTAQMVVSWNTDEPGTSQVEFGEGTGTTYSQKSQEDVNLTMNHLVIISNLTPAKVYHLRSLSKDKANNLGNSIDTVTITPKATENALNLVISNLQQAFGFLGGIGQ